ncbi:MAG: NAD(P)H-dependent glycerol-3-phosphate dehydrogenase [Spirochaetales bacterium]
MSDARIAVLGGGSWGTAIAKAIADKGQTVVVWTNTAANADDLNTLHENRRYLPGVKLPETLIATADIREAAEEREYLILAQPSLFILQSVKDILNVACVQEGRATISVLAKGFLPGGSEPKLIVETLENYLPGFYKNNLVYISGPSHAEEVVEGKITGLISASSNPRNSIRVRNLLRGRTLKVFASMDVVGVQVCAALKNVVAIAFGIMDALKERSPVFGDNTESLLLAAGLNEIQILGKALGATHPETFTSIAGVGDLDVTCRSPFGRNRRFGRDIILKNLLDSYSSIDDLIANISRIGYLPEGVMAARHAWALYEKYKPKIEIIPVVYRILNKELPPEAAIRQLIDIEEVDPEHLTN